MTTGHVQAKKKGKKKTNNYFALVEAYAQQAPTGSTGPPQTGTHFIIVWTAAEQPGPFFWRGDGGWLSCSMASAHKIKNRRNIRARYKEYDTEDVLPGQVQKGDTLELSPVTGGKFPIPAEIPAAAKNTLFFKAGGSTWLAFPVKTIEQKQDVPRQ